MAIRTIILRGERNHREFTAAGTILPGHLVVVGSAGTITVHGVAGGAGRKLVALEDGLQGKTVADAYASGNLVFADAPKAGDVRAFILKTGTNYTPDMALVSDGTGKLQPLTALPSASRATAFIIGYPQTALNLTVGGSVDTLHPVDIV